MQDYVVMPFHLRSLPSQFTVKFFAIQDLTPGLDSQSHDGLLGLGPSKEDEPPSFLTDQVNTNSQVTNQILSMYISNKTGELSHIKFGGWDAHGMRDGAKLTEFDTVSATSLAVNIGSVKFAKKAIPEF